MSDTKNTTEAEPIFTSIVAGKGRLSLIPSKSMYRSSERDRRIVGLMFKICSHSPQARQAQKDLIQICESGDRYLRKDPQSGRFHLGSIVVCDCGSRTSINEVSVFIDSPHNTTVPFSRGVVYIGEHAPLDEIWLDSDENEVCSRCDAPDDGPDGYLAK